MYGIKSFAFNARINDGIDYVISGNVTETKNNEWSYYDNSIVLNVGDVLYYVVNVDYNDGNGITMYSEPEESFTVTGIRLLIQYLSIKSQSFRCNIPYRITRRRKLSIGIT